MWVATSIRRTWLEDLPFQDQARGFAVSRISCSLHGTALEDLSFRYRARGFAVSNVWRSLRSTGLEDLPFRYRARGFAVSRVWRSFHSNGLEDLLSGLPASRICVAVAVPELMLYCFWCKYKSLGKSRVLAHCAWPPL